MKRILQLVVLLLVAVTATLSGAHRLENKSATIATQTKDGLVTETLGYSQLLAIVVGAPTRDGLTADQMSKRLRIIEACRASTPGEALILEDADWDLAVQIVGPFPWATGVNPDIVAFTEAIKAAPRIEPEKK